MSKILFFDTETTGLPAKGAKWETDFNQFPHIVQFAWSIDGQFKDRIIKPDGYIIPEQATAIHGITTEQALKEGIDVKIVLDEFLKDALAAKTIVAHNLYFDSSIIKANTLRLQMPFFASLMNDALATEKRVCTMMKTIKFVGAEFPDGRKNKFPKLEELYFKLFEDTFPAHNALEDVKAVISCYYKLIELKILS